MAQNKYLFNIPPKVWTVLSQWAHIFVGAMTLQYTIHHTTAVSTLLKAGGCSLIPLIFRWANPSDSFPAPNLGLVAADKAVKGDAPEYHAALK